MPVMTQERDAIKEKAIQLRLAGAPIQAVRSECHISQATLKRWMQQYVARTNASQPRESSIEFSGRAYARGYRWTREI